jgi:hypothetical protein
MDNLNNLVSAMDALAKSSYARFNAYSYIRARLNSIYSQLPPGLISYNYNKQYGPFVINTKPTANTLIVKSFIAGTLDSSDSFKYSPIYNSLQQGIQSASSRDGSNTITVLPFTPSTTQDSTVVPNDGIKNAKVYKLDYQDGSFNGSYKSLVAGDSCGSGLLTTQNSITFSLTGSATSPSVALNSINLMIGLKYQLVVSVKATTSCTMKLEYANSKYYMMSTDVTTIAGNTVSVNLTSTFVMFVWNFTALSSTITFRINKSSSSTNTIIEFNGLSIQGGLTAPLLPLACANGTTVTGILNGTTTVCST